MFNLKMTRLFLIMLITISLAGTGIVSHAEAQTINGAGASFPYPVYSQWAFKYNQITGVKLNYQSIGSGGGIRQIQAKTVDFGASDAPLKADELDKFGLLQFPMIMGGVVPVINLKGIKGGQLKLNSDVLVNLFLGNITKWNDPAIAALNPDLVLPDKDVTIVHRSDGSGTTWIYTNYLSAVSSEWKEKVGASKAVSWPVGIGGKGNEGVTAYVQRIDGSIGYVEFAYALQNKLTYVLLQNRAGKFVPPTKENFEAAAANADWKHSHGFYVVLVDQPGDDSWPITGASFIILYKQQENNETATEMLKFFDWCYKHGREIALNLDYVPMPENVVQIVQQTWKNEIRLNGKPVWE